MALNLSALQSDLKERDGGVAPEMEILILIIS